MKKYVIAWLTLTSGTVALCGAATAQAPPPGLVTCTRMADAGERLRCYDQQMAAMGAVVAIAPPAPPEVAPKAPVANNAVASVPVPPAVVAVPPPPTPEARFGAEDLTRAARPKEAKPDKVLLAKISSIREARPKLFVIVLANGQIWLQEGTQITSFFRAGYDARIEKGLLGDYRMSTVQTGEKNEVRVTRLQ